MGTAKLMANLKFASNGWCVSARLVGGHKVRKWKDGKKERRLTGRRHQ